MSMATLRFYKNPYHYPDYGSITQVGNSLQCTPVGMGLRTGTIQVKGNMADFMNCNYLSITRSGKTLYAWVDEVRYHTANSFEVSYTVDAWRTYRNNVILGTQYIERSPRVTNKPDNLLDGLSPTPNTRTLLFQIGNGAKRVFVVQTRVPSGAAYTRSPVQPTPYQFFLIEYDVNNWQQTTPLMELMLAVSGAEPENIVTMYSVPYFDTSQLGTQPLILEPSGQTISGFKFLGNSVAPNTLLYNETTIDIDEDINDLRRREHSVQVVIPEAGIMSIPDELLVKENLRLRQDIDLFSGACNYMLVTGTADYYTQSVRGSSISSIPIVSDPFDTYLSQNQNALATSLIGDVASIASGVAAAGATGGVGAAIGGGMAASGFNNIVGKVAQMKDMATQYSNPPAFLGTALAANFNGVFWVVITKESVSNADQVHSNFGYPLEMVDTLTFPSKGYIKTRGCTVRSDGTVPQWAIQEINSRFDNGIYVH